MRVVIGWGDGSPGIDETDDFGLDQLEDQPVPGGPKGVDLAYWFHTVVGHDLLPHTFEEPGDYVITITLFPYDDDTAVSAQTHLYLHIGAAVPRVLTAGAGPADYSWEPPDLILQGPAATAAPLQLPGG